jgi:D-glycero-D-manno-heptose 1,7-bisphosphate phosphatase
MRAIFLDRDGVINEESPDYIKSWEEFHFLPGSLEAIKLLSLSDFKVFVVTTASGIARKFFTEADLTRIHETMLKEIRKNGGRIDGIYYCPHLPKDLCKCRKPETGLFEQALENYDIDIENSYIIGDKGSDIEAGKRFGCKTIRVRTGYGSSYSGPEPDFVAQDLLEAAKYIVNLESLK